MSQRAAAIVRMSCAALMVFSCAFVTDALAASDTQYPTRPIRIVVGFPAGASPNDAVARLLGAKLAERFSEQVIVDNRPGAAGTIGSEIVAKAAPDGHTLLVNSSTLTIAPNAYKNLGFDPARDLLPITMVASAPHFIFVHNAVPANNLKELIAYVKTQPGKFKFSSGGNGTIPHLAGEMLNHMAGLQMVHIPYKGGAPAATALLSGEVSMFITTPTGSEALLYGGKVKVLGVAARTRSAILPDVPTTEEGGLPGYELIAWYGVFAPGKTPAHIVQRLYAEIRRIIALPDIKSRFTAMGTETADVPPAEFQRIYLAELQRWAKFVRDTGLKLD
ncbi:MAG TPA: tripartite tricarboxylate transporter substrate binding protein [Burkholderiales bacterium]|nr:tripartite tricarboxylate transporter substrate binding protein [Burkholderiales bacterium]